MSAGTGGNPRNVETLKQLGELTGSDMLGQAQELAAMRTFSNAPYLPVDTTGKSMLRSAIPSAVGFMTGGPVGAATGAVLSSPLTLKTAIDVGRSIKPAVDIFNKVIPGSAKEQLYKGLIQKYFESPSDQIKEEPKKENPDQAMIMDKIKGSHYESILQNALNNGGQKSFAAANYVLKNRDENYRKLFEEEGA